MAFLGSVIGIGALLLDTSVEFDLFNQPDAPPPRPGAQVTAGVNVRDLLLLDA